MMQQQPALELPQTSEQHLRQEAHRIIHHGGHEGVTGSCHQLFWRGSRSVLIDCGLFQGREAAGNPLEIGFPTGEIDALVITHAHLDHAGRIPYLLAAGFSGPIYCSEPTAALLPLILADAFSLSLSSSRLLQEEYLAIVQSRLRPLPYRQWETIASAPGAESRPAAAAPPGNPVCRLPAGSGSSLRIRLHEAGHILGSAVVECAVETHRPAEPETRGRTTERILFSGDLGAPFSPLLKAPAPIWGCDRLILESTYGDTLHPDRKTRKDRLAHILTRAAANRGVILIPAFSLGRTQELLYELEDLTHHGRIDLEIIIDSPLAARLTEQYRQLRPYWDQEARGRLRAGRHPLQFDSLYTVDSHEEHRQTLAYLQRTARPAVVIAGSGMCTGGRIVNYLKALVGDSRTDILFVGYQTEGTPGRDIQRYGPGGGWVQLDGKRYAIRAGIWTVTGYSAHADQRNLLNYVRRMRKLPREIQLVHGEPAARQALAELLRQHLPGVTVGHAGQKQTAE